MPLDVNYYAIISDAVERGLQTGIRRLYKYKESPILTEEEVLNYVEPIRYEIMNAIGEYLRFPEDPSHAERP